MTLALRYAARSDVGLLREGNEDAMYAGPRLLAVADGMGGHAAGEVASRVVIETVAGLDRQPPDDDDVIDALRRAVDTANDYLRDMVAADGALEGMGTTLTALLWVGEQLGLAHVGDSRGYLLRDGVLEQVTHDHTLVQSLIDEGRITAEEATTHPQRSWITRALDGRRTVDLDVSLRDVRVGDRYLLCSDGLSSYVSEATIAEALGLPDAEQACDRLVELALRAGGPDNITCIVADLVEDAATDPEPIVGGAAAEGATSASSAGDSPASRAAALSPRPGDGNAVAPESADPTPHRSEPPEDPGGDVASSRAGGSSRRLVAVLVGVVVLVLLAALGTFLYIRTQFYVGVAAGSPATVGVYRGVSGGVLGVDLSRLADRTDVPVTALPDYERSRVDSGIPAASHADAQRIVRSLRGDACAQTTPTASPSPTSTRSRQSKQAATPAPSPTPSFCASTP